MNDEAAAGSTPTSPPFRRRGWSLGLGALFLLMGGAVWVLTAPPVELPGAVYLPIDLPYLSGGHLGTLSRDSSGDFSFEASGAEVATPVTDDLFEVEGLLLRLRRQRTGASVELAGAVLKEGTVGGAWDADRTLKGPGFGLRHVEVLRAGCPSAAPCVRVGGVDGGTRLVTAAGHRPLAPGELVAISSGDQLWLGLTPLDVELDGDLVRLVVPTNYENLLGSRRWLGQLLPSWSIDGDGPWEVYSEDRYFRWTNPEQLPQYTIDHQREEELQRLVEAGALCLEQGAPFAAPGSGVAVPRVVWRSASSSSCGRAVPASRFSGGTVTWSDGSLDEEVRTLAARYQQDRSLTLLLDRANRALAQGTYIEGPAVLGFTFDWATLDGVPGLSGFEDGLPVPTKLLGVSWGSMRQQVSVSQSQGPSVPQDLLFRTGSTSPHLSVTEGVGGLLAGDRVLLVGGPTPVEVQGLPGRGLLLAALCVAEQPLASADPTVFRRLPAAGGALAKSTTKSTFYGSTVPAGQLSIRTGDAQQIQLLPLTSTPAGDCLLVARDQRGALHSSLDEAATWAPWPLGAPQEWNEASFVAVDHGDVAATTEFVDSSPKRVFPFGEDAGQLVGGAGFYGNGLDSQLRAELATRDEPLELSVHGDLQRLLHEALASAMEVRLRPASEETETGDRATAVLLDATTGAVLAAANWPPLRPNAEAGEDQPGRAQLTNRGQRLEDNWAFVRDLHIGSTFKIATALAGFRGGAYAASTVGGEATQGCSWGVRLYRGSQTHVEPREGTRTRGADSDRERALGPGMHYLCLGNHTVLPDDPGDAAAGLGEALKRSCNVYFGLTGLSLIGGQASLLGGVQPITLDLSLPVLGLPTSGSVLFRSDSRLGALIRRSEPAGAAFRPPAQLSGPPSFLDSASGVLGPIPGPDLNPVPSVPTWNAGNRFWAALMVLGHRFQYKASGGEDLRAWDQREDEWAPGASYPTAAGRRWFPGLASGTGGAFRYPSIPGPAAFSASAWPQGADLSSFAGGRFAAVSQTGNDRVVATVARGFQVEVSALALTVPTAAIASVDGSVPAPWIVRRAGVERRLVGYAMLQVEEIRILRDALKEVVSSGTGSGYFEHLGGRQPRLDGLVGGKTGTADTKERPRTPASESLGRVRRFACGGVVLDPAGGGLVPPSLSSSDWRRFESQFGPQPRAGFAAEAPMCRSMVPGRPAYPAAPEAVALAFQAAWRASRDSQEEGSPSDHGSFVGAVLEPLVPVPAGQTYPPVEVALRTGQGLVLAVIVDYNARASKEAAAAVLSDIDVYFQVRGDAWPR